MIMECIMLNNIPSQEIYGPGDDVKKHACLIPINIFKKYLLDTYMWHMFIMITSLQGEANDTKNKRKIHKNRIQRYC